MKKLALGLVLGSCAFLVLAYDTLPSWTLT